MAIIAVLVAIAVPLFVGALDEAKEATFDANKRALRSTAVTALLEEKDQTHLKELGSEGVLYATGKFSDGVITEITWSKKGTDTVWKDYKEGDPITVAIAQTDIKITNVSEGD